MREKRLAFLQKHKKRLWMFGFFGFFGCGGFMYFFSGNVSDLFYFAFFAFFAYFFIGKFSGETPDERLIENSNKAAAKCFGIPMIALYLTGWGVSRPFGTELYVVLVSAVGWAATFLTYAILLWYYERH
jgi:uncharacterized membrane protein YjjP (DUF1212 family)